MPAKALLRSASAYTHFIPVSQSPPAIRARTYSQQTSHSPWRPATALDEWAAREARPISLRQLTVFGRSLTEARLLSSANYARTELPTRIAHRLRDMQGLPYVVINNPHMSQVYELYAKSFDVFRRFPEVKSLEENDHLCKLIRQNLEDHLAAIPRLLMGMLESSDMAEPALMDGMIETMLRSRISRRVIAEQHLALTETFHSPWHFPDAKHTTRQLDDLIGEVFLHCNAREIVERCAATVRGFSKMAYGPDAMLPEVTITGDIEATLTYIPSHLEYIIGELLRNSVQAAVEFHSDRTKQPPPIDVLICESAQHVIFRISDRNGGMPKDVEPFVWSFVKGPRAQTRLKNLHQVPHLAATMREIKGADQIEAAGTIPDRALGTLAGRPPNLRLGVGLPISRTYAEYWAGTLEVQNLEGYGLDVFLQISKLGNKNEQLTTRESMDSL